MGPRPFPSPVSPAFQPMKAPFMPWDESSFNTSGSRSSNMSVKVRVLSERGLASRGWPGGLQFTPRGVPHPLLLCLNHLQDQSEDPGSVLTLFRRLSDHRGKERSLLHGDFHTLSSGPSLFSYIRQWDQNERFLVVLNFGDMGQPARLGASSLPASASLPARVDLLLSTQTGREEGASLELEHLKLEPHEGLLLRFPYVP